MGGARKQLGEAGERHAEEVLRRARYVILERNYRCLLGEVDLVALDGRTVVFVEVKTRTQTQFGSPHDAVDHRKQRQLQRVANYYLSRHRLHDRDARFDVVAIHWVDGTPRAELIQNAFDASG
ncbi:MAG: YraN family protein [Deltaproteobacteria bacterium]|nr:YraN family protein [Deltaproteobacteria bacterium]